MKIKEFLICSLIWIGIILSAIIGSALFIIMYAIIIPFVLISMFSEKLNEQRREPL